MTDDAAFHVGDAPVLDPGAIDRVRRIGGAQLVARMIDAFLDHVPARADVVVTAADAADVRNPAHAIRSSAGNLGLERLRRRAEAIEASIEAGDSIWQSLRPLLAEELASARAALNEVKEQLQ